MRLDDYTRVYTEAGTRVHLLDPLLSPNQPNSALCGRSPMWPGLWLGTGSQEEYERALDLDVCNACVLRHGERGRGELTR